uniref:NADH dehydrogenase subunit 1b n=1 Tax=Moneuplotes minuta TaxID=74792 RepID=D1LDQ3_9SPIT|nr:NADH dehydrogenase subunit 1b [Moneuplotes minuta]
MFVSVLMILINCMVWLIDFWESLFDYHLWLILMLNPTFAAAVKVILTITMLVLIRASLPRYRYDYLTKLGWVKFLLVLVILMFISYLGMCLWF